MKLYTNSGSPNGRRVNIALAEKGLQIEKVEIDLQRGQNLADEFLARNPFGRVPVLELPDGTWLAESVAQAFRNLTGFFKDREKVCREWGEISLEVAQQATPLFDAALGRSRFIAGETFSVADISLLCTLDFARATRQALPLDLPNLRRWHAEVTARPSAKA